MRKRANDTRLSLILLGTLVFPYLLLYKRYLKSLYMPNCYFVPKDIACVATFVKLDDILSMKSTYSL